MKHNPDDIPSINNMLEPYNEQQSKQSIDTTVTELTTQEIKEISIRRIWSHQLHFV